MTAGENGGDGSGWRSTLEVRQLRAFLAVVAHGSVSGAAAALGLAQSTVSEALSALDRALGVQTILRRRGGHETALTNAGKALLPHARRVLEDLDAVHLAIAGVTHSGMATVNVTANESVSTYLLAPALGVLRKRWPNTRFSVSIGTCSDVRSDVADGSSKIGLLLESYDGGANSPAGNVGTRPADTATTIVLASDVPLVIFAGAKHPLVRHTRRTALARDTITASPMFVADAAGDFHELISRYFASDGLPGPRFEPVGSIDGVKRGVDADASALGILPHYAVAEDLRSGRVRALELTPTLPRVRLIAILPPAPVGRHPAIAELIEHLRIG